MVVFRAGGLENKLSDLEDCAIELFVIDVANVKRNNFFLNLILTIFFLF